MGGFETNKMNGIIGRYKPSAGVVTNTFQVEEELGTSTFYIIAMRGFRCGCAADLTLNGGANVCCCVNEFSKVQFRLMERYTFRCTLKDIVIHHGSAATAHTTSPYTAGGPVYPMRHGARRKKGRNTFMLMAWWMNPIQVQSKMPICHHNFYWITLNTIFISLFFFCSPLSLSPRLLLYEPMYVYATEMDDGDGRGLKGAAMPSRWIWVC